MLKDILEELTSKLIDIEIIMSENYEEILGINMISLGSDVTTRVHLSPNGFNENFHGDRDEIRFEDHNRGPRTKQYTKREGIEYSTLLEGQTENKCKET